MGTTETPQASLPETSGTDAVRLSINLAPDVAQALRTMAQRQGVSITEAVRRAISTEKFFRDEAEKGSKVLVEDTNKNIRQILLR
jgi:hypothetical protein